MKNKVSIIFVNQKLGILFIGFKFGTILMFDLENTTVTNGYISQLEFQESSIEILSHGRFLISKDSKDNIFIYDIPLARPNSSMKDCEQIVTLCQPNDIQTQWSKTYTCTVENIEINNLDTQMCVSLTNKNEF